MQILTALFITKWRIRWTWGNMVTRRTRWSKLSRLAKSGWWTGGLGIGSVLLCALINRPGVAGAVLQSPLSLIHSFIDSLIDSVILFLQNFKTSLHPNHKS